MSICVTQQPGGTVVWCVVIPFTFKYLGKNIGTAKIYNFSLLEVKTSFVKVKSFHANINHSRNANSVLYTDLHTLGFIKGWASNCRGNQNRSYCCVGALISDAVWNPNSTRLLKIVKQKLYSAKKLFQVLIKQFHWMRYRLNLQ